MSATERLCLLSLADRANEDHECWPSVNRLTCDTEMDRHTVIAVLKRLEVKGLVIKNQGSGVVSRYTLVGVAGREGTSGEKHTSTSGEKHTSVEKRTSGENHHQPVGKSTLEPKREPRRNSEDSLRSSSSFAVSEKISLSADGIWEQISTTQRELWSRAYPALSLDAELASAAAWIVANPANRKSNYARFITNWLKRAQDRAPRAADPAKASAHAPYAGQAGEKPTTRKRRGSYDDIDMHAPW